MGAEVAAAIETWLAQFAEAALKPAEVDHFVRSVDDEIIAAIPEIAGDPALVEDLHASTRAHWRNFLVGISEEFRLALPPSADRKSTRLNSSHVSESRMPSSA